KDSRPRQLILMLRDKNDRFHVRLLNPEDLHRLPKDVLKTILEGRRTNSGHVFVGPGTFYDSGPSTRVAADDDETPSGSAKGKGRTRPRPKGDKLWKKLAAFVKKAENTPRAKRVRTVEERMRNQSVREL